MLNEKDPKHLEMKRKLRLVGFVCLGLGLIIEIIALSSFFSMFGNIGNPGPDMFNEFGRSASKFGLSFLGMPLLALGIILVAYSYIGEVARYSATEVAPVTKDVVNYMVDGTKDSIKTVVSSVSEGLKGTSNSTQKTVKCRHCQADNDHDAKFCDNCGKPMVNHKVCSQCQSKNELDALFCKQCGTRFYN